MVDEEEHTDGFYYEKSRMKTKTKNMEGANKTSIESGE